MIKQTESEEIKVNDKFLPADNVRLRADDSAVVIIDQSALPGKTCYLELADAAAMHNAIYSLKVRGAPAIGICAAYCLYVLARNHAMLNREDFLAALRRDADYLSSSRPTAVNLSWALQRLLNVAEKYPEDPPSELLLRLRAEACAIQQEDIDSCFAISHYGLTLLHEGCGVLTHCNAGPLATSRYGTALGPLLLAHEQGMSLRVFADETRPLLQGARLTSYELSQAGLDVTLICDNMASIVMKNGWVDACFVGCDRIAANGDTANKIGTSGVAILAKYYGIPFYVLGPTSTIDLNCADGSDIVIEQRDGEEIKHKFYREPMAPDKVKCYNPAFDVTDASLIAAIVTERGICLPPYEKSLSALFAEEGDQ